MPRDRCHVIQSGLPRATKSERSVERIRHPHRLCRGRGYFDIGPDCGWAAERGWIQFGITKGRPPDTGRGCPRHEGTDVHVVREPDAGLMGQTESRDKLKSCSAFRLFSGLHSNSLPERAGGRNVDRTTDLVQGIPVGVQRGAGVAGREVRLQLQRPTPAHGVADEKPCFERGPGDPRRAGPSAAVRRSSSSIVLVSCLARGRRGAGQGLWKTWTVASIGCWL